MRTVLKQILPLAVALCLLLTACGSGVPAPFDPAATATALKESEAFSQVLEEIDADIAATYFGLDETAVQSITAFGSLSAGAEQIAVLTLADEKSATTAKELLQRYLEDQKSALNDYQPEEVSKLDAALLEQRGSSVALVVAADADKAQAVLDGLK